MAIITEDERLLKKKYEVLDNRKEDLLPDAVCGYQFRRSNMMQCPHPAIRKKYASVTGECWVSSWTCKAKCRYAVTYPMHGGVSCGYEKEKEHREQSGRADQESAE